MSINSTLKKEGIIVIGSLKSTEINKIALNKFTAAKISQYFNQGKLYRWMNLQISEIYRKHPEYRPMNIEQFKKTGRWERLTGEWRDKTRSQQIRRLSNRLLVIILGILLSRLKLPMADLYSIPARILLAYMGCKLAVGSINNLVVEHEGNSILIGLTLTRAGLELTNAQLLVKRNDNKMVHVDIPRIPPELYMISKKDVENHRDESIITMKKRIEAGK